MFERDTWKKGDGHVSCGYIEDIIVVNLSSMVIVVNKVKKYLLYFYSFIILFNLFCRS